MTISYNWLCEYLPIGPTTGANEKATIEKPSPELLSGILTAIGLEVESLEQFEEIKNGLKGLIVGEVVSCEKHPDADKLKLTRVSDGHGNTLQVVCGAANVATGQKVVFAPAGTTIYPTTGDPISLRKAKIRGAESEGMICAEDEIGLGSSHDGILVLPADTPVGIPVSTLFEPYEDHIFEIGLTPNRMDAMSHLGVAKDICAWMSCHYKKEIAVRLPLAEHITQGNTQNPVSVNIENKNACKRYSGISIHGITVKDSPKWLKQRLASIGLKPLNNIVDITNFILHETGQPLHAFDEAMISGNRIVVRNAAEGSVFKTLDDKERKLSARDLMICNANEPMCIAGIYGGINSGVTTGTKNIFLESAWFDPTTIRNSSMRLGLRTDAASRFEKGTDISNTVNVLIRAVKLVLEVAGGGIAGSIVDEYPSIPEKKSIRITNAYLKKLSGKDYAQADVKNILVGLGFEVSSEDMDAITVFAPYSKPDISIPADLVEEIMRIDGLDNVIIPTSIRIAPSVEKSPKQAVQKERIANYLVGLGYHEVFTNSISNSQYYERSVLDTTVKMLNSLNAGLDILRPAMLQGGLLAIAHNLNRKNTDLRFYEFGKTYRVDGENKYGETNHLALYVTGNTDEPNWKTKEIKSDFYYLKAAVEKIMTLTGAKEVSYQAATIHDLGQSARIFVSGKEVGFLGEVSEKTLKQFDIRQPVFYADIDFDSLLGIRAAPIQFQEISRFPAVDRDLAIVVDKNVSYNEVEQIALSCSTRELRSIKLFDVFESDKLGAGKKSMAISFIFMDESKTLTDKEIDSFMQKIIRGYEEKLGAAIRK